MGITTWEANANYAASVTLQTPSAATRTYITNSSLTQPAGKFQIGARLKWRLNLTKTATGTASSTFEVCFGTAGASADTARLSFTKPAGTAAADEGFIEIDCIVRGPISASCIVTGSFRLVHNLSATGHSTVPAVVLNAQSAAFDITAASVAGLAVSPGAADVYTIQQVDGGLSNV